MNWKPLRGQLGTQGFPRKVKKKDLFFLCLPPDWNWDKRCGMLITSGKTVPGQRAKQPSDTCAAPGHPWGLTVRWIICLESKGIVLCRARAWKSDRLSGFLFEWPSSSKRDTILDSREDHPLNWNHWPLWLLSMQGKSKNVTDFVTENTGTSLERCSFQSQFS